MKKRYKIVLKILIMIDFKKKMEAKHGNKST